MYKHIRKSGISTEIYPGEIIKTNEYANKINSQLLFYMEKMK